MPSFGLPTSMPPGSSSLAPCMSTLVSSNISSCQETSSAPPGPDGCMSYLFGSPNLPPPPPLSLSDAAPYSPPPAYPTVFPFGPSLPPSARFPPPPNPSFARPISNISFFEGPQPRYPIETPYDRWSDRNVNSTAHYGGGDHMAKSFGHWSVPFNSSMNVNSSSNNNNNNSNLGFLKSDPIFPPLAPYPPVDSLTNFGPKFSTLSGFPNAAGMPSTPSASVTSPLASGHFGAFPPPSLLLDFPHTSGGRYPFNPHASNFLPGLDPPPAFGPGNAEFMPEPIPSYLSRAGGYQPSSSFQGPDHFHDPSPPPIASSENGSRPITSEPASCFYGPNPETFHLAPNLLSHTFSSRSDNASGVLCTSEGPPILDFSSDFPAPFTLPYPPPHPGSLYPPYSSGPLRCLYQDSPWNAGGSSTPKRDKERKDRIVGETGKLMYQHMSPEEWRWKHYEPSFTDALDPSGIFGKVRPSGYNHFNGVDSPVYCTVSNSSSGFGIKEEGSTSGVSRSQKRQQEILELSKAQSQSGPSLKLAASALAEMLASGSNGTTSSTGRSMVSQVEVTPGPAMTSECGFHFGNACSGGQARSERILEDCCSSSGAAVVRKEITDGSSSLTNEFKGLTFEGYVSGLNLYSPTGGKPEISDLPEDAFSDFGAAPVVWALPKASEQINNTTSSRPVSWIDAVPQSGKDGPMHESGQRRVSSKGSAAIAKHPSVSIGPAKLHGVVAESSTSEYFNNLFTQASDCSSRPQSGRIRKGSSEPVGVQSSEDPASVIGPCGSLANAASGLSLFGEVSSSGLSSQLPTDASYNDHWHGNSTSCGSSPPLSQEYLDILRSITGPAMGASSRVCPERSSEDKATSLGTGFHSLTASISNLSKVLFSLDTSAVRPPDSAVLEETLQSSILRLSECLLLEQSRINRNPTTRFVGSDDSAASRQARDDAYARHCENNSSLKADCLTVAEIAIMPDGSISELGNVKDLMDTSTIAALENVAPRDSVINSHRMQRPFLLNNVSDSVSKRSMSDAGIRAVKDSGRVYDSNSKPSSSSQRRCAVADEMLQLLWENDIDLSSLERLIDAAAEGAELKVLVERLREELQLEREENRGTALLCEKIMHETQVSKGKAVMVGAQKGDLESKNSTLDGTYKGEASGVIDQSGFMRHEKVRQRGFGEDIDSAPQPKTSGEPSMNEVDQVESRLALILERRALTAELNLSNQATGSKLRDDTDAEARGNSSEETVVNKGHLGESQRSLLAQPTAIAPHNISNNMSRSVESRLALLQARQTDSSHDINGDVDAEVTYPGAIRSPRQDATTDEVEARRALLLQGRPGWNNELGVFTETEPCTPANPAVVDLDSRGGSVSGHSSPGLNEALKAHMSHITSQLLIQSESISNMHTAWSQLSEQVNSKSMEKECHADIQQKEVDEEISNASTYPCDGSQAVEARAHLIRSRPDCTEGDVSESDTEDSFDGQVYAMSSTNSGSLRYETDQFENEISVVRLLDSDVVSQSIQLKTATDRPSLRGAMGETSKFESENPAITQDIEEDSGWEHVLLPTEGDRKRI